MSHLTCRKLVQNEIELERPPLFSPDSLTPLLCILDDSPAKSIEAKKICFNYKSYDCLRKICDHARKLIGPGCARPWNRFKIWVGSCSLKDDLSVHSPVEFTKKIFTRQQKREELEREVIVLQKILSHEKKVHEYLERLHSREDGSTLSILNFIPPKMKEIVAELVMVENEIARLESQIKRFQHHKDDINVHKNMYNEWGHRRTLKNHLDASSNPHVSRRLNENVAATTFDTMALHFISKAIKVDYHLADFSTNEKLIKENIFEGVRE